MLIRLYYNVFDEKEPEEFETDNLCQWLIDRYGQQPKINIDVFVGEPDNSKRITGEIASIVNAQAPLYSVVESPGDPTAILIQIVILVIGMILAPDAQQPSNVNRSQQSPNNGFGDRSNSQRLFQRVEDIYGRVQAVPALLMQTWDYYDATGNKFERSYLCVGRGYYDVQAADVLEATTPFSSIPNSRLSIFPPFVAPDGDVSVAQLSIGGGIAERPDTRIKYKNISSIVMKASNQLGLSGEDEYFFRDNFIVQLTREPDFNTVFSSGDQCQVTMDDTDYTPTINDVSLTFVASTSTVTDTTDSGIFDTLSNGDRIKFTSTSNTGTYTVNTVVDVGAIRHITTVESVVDAVETTHFVIIVNYSGTYNITAVTTPRWHVVGITDTRYPTGEVSDYLPTLTVAGSFPYMILGDAGSAIPIMCVVSQVGAPTSEWTEWFPLNDTQQTKLLFNINATNGLYKDAGGGPINTTVDTEFQVQELVAGTPTGAVFTTTTLTARSNGGNNSTGASLLYDLQASAGFVGACQVRGRRSSLHDFSFQGTVQDEITWESLYSVAPQTKPNFGNKTTLLSDVRVNQRATVIQNRQLNITVFRKLPTWNGSVWSAVLRADGSLYSGTLNTTYNPVDIIAAITQDKKIGNRPLSEVDVVQIQSVVDTINAWNTNCSQFSYTFDSDSISYEEHISIVANAVFCESYRQNSKIRLAFDAPQPVSAAVVTHRSKKPGAVDTISRSFFDDSDYDGVQVVYADPDTKVSETFYLPLDGNYAKAKKIEVPGIRNFTQAWFRANREFNRIFNQRIALQTTMTMEASAFTPNLRVDIVDNTRFKVYAGEVLNYDSGTKVLTLTDDVVFKAGLTHTVTLVKRDGTVEIITCTASTSPDEVVLTSDPVEAVVVVGGIDGIRTVYSFAASDDREAMAYRIRRVHYSDPPYTTVEAVNYSASDYAADFETVPARQDIIGV